MSLSSDTLFVQQPDPANGQPRLTPDYVAVATPAQLVDATYYALKDPGPNTLQIWELRLVLLLFNHQLAAAKQEAVNLNNALYLLENEPPKPGPDAAIYPLPKNNDGSISFALLLLVLRLKSVPNLALVNELYKLCYQLRLKGSTGADVQPKLAKLAYAVMLVLAITRNYFTLLSFLDSLRADIRGDLPLHRDYASNVSLVWVLVSMLILKARSTENKGDTADTATEKAKTQRELLHELLSRLQPVYSCVEQSSLDAVKYVLQTYSHIPGGVVEELHIDLSLSGLADLTVSGNISTRIICCTLAVWDLQTTFSTLLAEKEGKVVFEVEAPLGDTELDAVFGLVMSRWGSYVNKVFGIE